MSGHRDPRGHVALAAVVGVLLLTSACGRRSSGGDTPASSSTSAAAGATTNSSPTSTTTTATATTATATTATATTATATTVVTTTAVATTVDVAGATAAITANWERFFLPTTSLADRIGLLENGATLQQALEQRSQDPLMQQASAVVKSVDVTSADHATVTYDVLLAGSVALADSQGVAVLQDGVWKVSANSFCALISLGATAPIPGCS